MSNYLFVCLLSFNTAAIILNAAASAVDVFFLEWKIWRKESKKKRRKKKYTKIDEEVEKNAFL